VGWRGVLGVTETVVRVVLLVLIIEVMLQFL
jgi:hypothetical protein